MTALQMVQAHLNRLVLTETSDWESGGEHLFTAVKAQLGIDYGDGYVEGDSLFFFVRIRLRGNPDTDKDKDTQSVFFVESEGVFSLPLTVEPEHIDYKVLSNSASVLLGYLRGVLSAISKNFRSGGFTLPCLSIDQMLFERQSDYAGLIEFIKTNLTGSSTPEPAATE